MKKPDELVTLLSTLEEENVKSSVRTDEDSKAVICIGKEQITLSRGECELVFHDDSRVEQFAESLLEIGDLNDANLEMYSLRLSEPAQAALEMYFQNIDDM